MVEGRISEHWDYSGREPILVGPAFAFVGQWWANGGPVAIALAGIFTGIMLRAFRNVYDRSPGSEGDAVLFMLLAPIGFFEAASTPLNFVLTDGYAIILAVIILKLCGGEADRARIVPTQRFETASY
jgi:hypothetical protein